MRNHLIEFGGMKWDYPRDGMSQKVRSLGGQQLRLVRFNEKFVENDWCTNAHIGYIISGNMKIDFKDHSHLYKAGDGLFILDGTKHKLSVENQQEVELILFETIQ